MRSRLLEHGMYGRPMCYVRPRTLQHKRYNRYARLDASLNVDNNVSLKASSPGAHALLAHKLKRRMRCERQAGVLPE